MLESLQINSLLAKVKPEIEGTFEIRINNSADKTYLYNYIYEYKHWQNIITILVTYLFKKNDSDYRYFLDYEIVRACVGETAGSIKNRQKFIILKRNIKIMNSIKAY